MRHSSQCEIGSRTWRESMCHEGNCQGSITEDHPARYRAMKKLYPKTDETEILANVLSGKCGPECNKHKEKK